MGEWEEWLAEGDAAGEPRTGQRYEWHTRSRTALQARPGDRMYIVAHGKLRGWAPIEHVQNFGDSFCIIRAGDAVACTLPDPVPGFRGLRVRWWVRHDERPFLEWKTP